MSLSLYVLTPPPPVTPTPGEHILSSVLQSPVIKANLPQLLKEKDADGFTPFMLAVRTKAYQAALSLYESKLQVLII